MYGKTKFAIRKNSRFKLRKFLFYLFNPTIIFQSIDAKAKIVWNSKCVNAKLQGQKHSSLRKNTILWNNEHSCFIQTRLMNPHEELYTIQYSIGLCLRSGCVWCGVCVCVGSYLGDGLGFPLANSSRNMQHILTFQKDSNIIHNLRNAKLVKKIVY